MVADLLLEAAALMFIGMVSVFAFLFVLVLLLQLMSKTIQRFFPVKVQDKTSSTETVSDNVSPAIIAAISAAVHQYRQKQ
ncbi:oxaloacetate decarboxylase subunit gamma [Alishewanella sp. d11]|uniref:oxaloacetate decarboxylase subunit gamma n=1 Tax=Alishewanella sp. d11 TaxID=3414030 RepID=UPI003BF88B6C